MVNVVIGWLLAYLMLLLSFTIYLKLAIPIWLAVIAAYVAGLLTNIHN